MGLAITRRLIKDAPSDRERRIMIGDNIIITLVKIKGNHVTILVDAPKSLPIVREELLSLQDVDRIEKAAKGDK